MLWGGTIEQFTIEVEEFPCISMENLGHEIGDSLYIDTELRDHPYESINYGCGHALAPLVIGKDHGQFLIESALQSWAQFCE